MKPLFFLILYLCSTQNLVGQTYRPMFFYSRGLLQDVIYLSAQSEITFYAEEKAGILQYYQKIETPKGSLTTPVYDHDSLTFTEPPSENFMRSGHLNILTTKAFSSLVYDFTTQKVSSKIVEGVPAVVYFWKEQEATSLVLLREMATRYGGQLLFYSVDLKEEETIGQQLPLEKSSALYLYSSSGTPFVFQGEWSADHLVEFIERARESDMAPLPYASLFASGVTEREGWYDVEKRGVPQDYMACWLITASNMLQWWQDRYVEKGNHLPKGTPHGAGNGPYQMAILDDAMTRFHDLEKGGSIATGLLWYIEGKSTDISGQSYPQRGTGGYLLPVSKENLDYSHRPFTTYDEWEKATSPAAAGSIFSEKILTAFQRGDVVGMDIKTHVGLGGALHAITIWGAAYDEQRQVRGLYITDSDDQLHQLVYCEVEFLEDPFFKTQAVALKVPKNETYVEGGKWEILKAYYLSCSPSH